MGKHTLGPWIVEQSDKTPIYVSPLDRREDISICQVLVIDEDEQSDGGEWINGDQTKANAHLIAAAPDMLAALEAAIECGMVPTSSAKEGGAMHYVRQAHVADQIRAAIAKAKGV